MTNLSEKELYHLRENLNKETMKSVCHLKSVDSATISKQIDEFLLAGGKIKKLEHGESGQHSAVTGSLKKDFDRARFNGRRR